MESLTDPNQHAKLSAALGRRTCGSGRVPSQDFLHDRGHVRQAVAVDEVGQAVGADNAVNFLLCARLHLRVQCDSEQEYLPTDDSLVNQAGGKLARLVQTVIPEHTVSKAPEACM